MFIDTLSLKQRVIMTEKIMKTEAKDGEIWSDMSSNENNPCLNCGACCDHFRISFYQGELKSMGGYVPDEKVISLTPFRAVMKGTESGGRCSCLIGEVGKSIGCSIYENRPSVCRAYHVWDENGIANSDCNRLRKKIGLSEIKNMN